MTVVIPQRARSASKRPRPVPVLMWSSSAQQAPSCDTPAPLASATAAKPQSSGLPGPSEPLTGP